MSYRVSDASLNKSRTLPWLASGAAPLLLEESAGIPEGFRVCHGTELLCQCGKSKLSQAPVRSESSVRSAFPGEQFGMNQAVFLNDTGANLTGRFTLFLHDGDLSVLTTGPAVSADDRYGLPLGSHTFAIGSGSGAFLNAKGVVVVTVSATGLRSFDVFLGPCRRP